MTVKEFYNWCVSRGYEDFKLYTGEECSFWNVTDFDIVVNKEEKTVTV